VLSYTVGGLDQVRAQERIAGFGQHGILPLVSSP
jgi:hypothetical protein